MIRLQQPIKMTDEMAAARADMRQSRQDEYLPASAGTVLQLDRGWIDSDRTPTGRPMKASNEYVVWTGEIMRPVNRTYRGLMQDDATVTPVSR